ncbi:acetyltransferase [Vibrio variabilis]|uniref:Acetyltransferase n=1 Tax=Vibrio variabilis TaxID=990271 RepID=A0ABQ0JB17_9VIBR|nr:acetyltransferase [Vibrio variabilis]
MIKLSFQDVILRQAIDADLPAIYDLMTGDENWTQLNGPYFGYERPTQAQFADNYFSRLKQGQDALVIEYLGRAIGTVSYYWEDKATRWLEVGVLVYDSTLWGRSIGKKALVSWVSHLFNTLDIARVGLTTWSGNPRMMRCAEKLGMQQEARLRKVRYYRGEYYDSVKYGVLREEWKVLEVQWRRQNHIYLFDWGDTLMFDDPSQQGKMCDWTEVRAVEGAVDLLKGLSALCPVYVATNAQDSTEKDIHKAFERVGLAQYLSGYFCYSNLGVTKDDAEFFPTIASRLNVSPERLVMTGDQTQRDIEPALRAGLRANWFNPSGLSDEGNNEIGFARLEEILQAEQSRLSVVESR